MDALKPLPVAPLTIEDSAVMEGIRLRWRYPLNHWYQYYDRCDAELMLELTERDYQRLRRYALSIGGTPTDWPE